MGSFECLIPKTKRLLPFMLYILTLLRRLNEKLKKDDSDSDGLSAINGMKFFLSI